MILLHMFPVLQTSSGGVDVSTYCWGELVFLVVFDEKHLCHYYQKKRECLISKTIREVGSF